MSLREELYERLEILEGGGLTSEGATRYCGQVIEILLSEKADVDEEKIAVFITHLAMAAQRALNGQEETPIDQNVLEEVKMEIIYPKAAAFADEMLAIGIVAFSQTEKDFLIVHLCNLFS